MTVFYVFGMASNYTIIEGGKKEWIIDDEEWIMDDG